MNMKSQIATALTTQRMTNPPKAKTSGPTALGGGLSRTQMSRHS